MKEKLVSVKGNREGLWIICNEEGLWEDIVAEIKKRLTGENGCFFEGASVVVDTCGRFLSTVEVSSLWKVIEENGLKVKSIRTDSKKDSIPTVKRGCKVEVNDLPDQECIVDKPVLVLKRNVRSGQNITFDGNVLIFGDVNPGAEIIASGFIMVMGHLRGTVHAGALGDEKAWVMSIRLQPTQLRIANCITRAPEEEPQGPEYASIHEGVIVCEIITNIGKYYELSGGI